MQKRFFILFLILSFILTSGAGCQLLDDPSEKPGRSITLKYWRVFEGRDAFNKIINRYNKMHPNINIKYRKLRYDNYREELLNAMAEDKGPDIFSIHNTWMNEYKSKISPMPETVTIGRLVTKGTVKKETVLEKKTKDTMSTKELERKFIDVVYDDVVIRDNKGQQRIYGLPFSVDTLALYYNKDLLNNAGIVNPPQYWDRKFQKTVKKLTKQDSKGKIIQSGVAMGGGDNIERATDILSVLMMQNGANMMTGNKNVTFDEFSGSYNPGLEALRFYTDFSNPAKEVYCWNDNLDKSLKTFMEGKAAMMFGYSYHLPTIKSQAPKLNFNISKLPQINNSSRKVNYANYWIEVVSQKSSEKDAAWDFLSFATQKDQAKTYLEKTNKPTALRDLIEEQKKDKEIGIFAEQLLTVKSWYKGYDALAMEKVMREMIEEANKNPQRLEAILGRGSERVEQTCYK